MPKKRRKSTADTGLRTVVIKSLVGSATGLALFFALAATVAFFCLKKDSDPTSYKFFVLAVGAVCGFVCGYVSVKPVRKKGMIIGALSSLPMYLVVIGTAVLVCRDGVGAVGWILCAVMLFAGAVGGIIAVN